MTIRLRLTLVYGLLFLTTGAALLGISYVIVQHDLPASRVSAVSVQDVRLRAEKLLGSLKPNDPDVDQLKAIVTGSNQALKALIADPSRLPKRYVESLMAELPSKVRSNALHSLVVTSLGTLGGMVLVSGVLGWFVAGRLLRPLDAITETARRLSAEDLHERIALQGPDDELRRLAETIDGMLGRLEAAFEGQRRFVANASHELRTPLTIMRTEIDVALRRPDASVDDLRAMAEVVHQTTERADRLITSLLALAAMEHGPEVTEPVDLAAVTQQALHDHREPVAARRVTVTTDLDPAVTVGDPGLLDRAVENLVDNAIVHNVDGGWLHVRTSVDEGTAVLEVANGGPKVVVDGTRLFEPFERGERTTHHHGAGLGLSIVRSVVVAHGGTVEAEPRADGGLRVTVRLPGVPTLPS